MVHRRHFDEIGSVRQYDFTGFAFAIRDVRYRYCIELDRYHVLNAIELKLWNVCLHVMFGTMERRYIPLYVGKEAGKEKDPSPSSRSYFRTDCCLLVSTGYERY